MFRDEVAAQQGTREIICLHNKLAEAGLGRFLNILVLTQAQHSTLFDATIATNGRLCTALQGGSGNYDINPGQGYSDAQAEFAQQLLSVP